MTRKKHGNKTKMKTRTMTQNGGGECFSGGGDWLTLFIVNNARGVGVLCVEEHDYSQAKILLKSYVSALVRGDCAAAK